MIEPDDEPYSIESLLVTALESTIPRYLRALRHAVEQSEGPDRITMQQLRCLQAVAEAPDGALTTALARRLRVAVPTMTRMLDGLVERGLVERRPDPISRRQVRVQPTSEGIGLVIRYEAIIEARLRGLIEQLSEERQQRLLLAIHDLAALLDRDAEAEHP